MGSRADEVRKRLEKRKKERNRIQKNIDKHVLWEDNDYFTSNEGTDEKVSNESFHPLFRKDLFLLKILGAAILFLTVAIIVKKPVAGLEKVETTIKQEMTNDFNFAVVSNWYEDRFGKPLAFLPTKEQEKSKEDTENLQQYALSASAKILEEFEENGQRIAIETGTDTAVQAMNEGMVTYIGEKEGFGNTVVIQHSDNSESWYGNLENTTVKLYEAINKGTKVGDASSYEGQEMIGLFYFAIRKNDDFIDPLQVIDFE